MRLNRIGDEGQSIGWTKGLPERNSRGGLNMVKCLK
jgi:hypothetical protein